MGDADTARRFQSGERFFKNAVRVFDGHRLIFSKPLSQASAVARQCVVGLSVGHSVIVQQTGDVWMIDGRKGASGLNEPRALQFQWLRIIRFGWCMKADQIVPVQIPILREPVGPSSV